MTTPNAIDIRDVQKNFGITKVIRDLNLQVAQGERHALIGPNGAGKSTTFNLISGYMAPTSGEVLMRGERIDGLALPDQPARPVALVSGHQCVRQHDGVGEPALRGSVGDGPQIRVLEKRRQAAGSS
jgi:ABC-type branched-subunit amino acid transport system ATPase component